MALLQIRNLTKHYTTGGRTVHAVDGVDLDVEDGETVGLVGESGCGKSTLGRCLTRLVEASSGTIRFAGEDLRAMAPARLRAMRRQIQTIFQDPYTSLDPRMRVGEIIGEGLAIHEKLSKAERREKVLATMGRVGLREEHYRRYAHEFSGGQRQRIAIARAIILEPRFIVADEPVSALDVSIQAQIVNLMQDLQEEMGLTYLFISHDLNVVEHVSHRVAVMYLGRIVEIGSAEAIYRAPRHPYTRALLSSAPAIEAEDRRERILLDGEIPSASAPPPGCRFHTRCPFREKVCEEKAPPLVADAKGDAVACHLFGES